MTKLETQGDIHIFFLLPFNQNAKFRNDDSSSIFALWLQAIAFTAGLSVQYNVAKQYEQQFHVSRHIEMGFNIVDRRSCQTQSNYTHQIRIHRQVIWLRDPQGRMSRAWCKNRDNIRDPMCSYKDIWTYCRQPMQGLRLWLVSEVCRASSQHQQLLDHSCMHKLNLVR